jgi:tetratricopeptide (TPR) repeat protein
MKHSVPWRWWWLAIGVVIMAGVLSRDRAGGIAAAIVVAGMLVWAFWPVVYAQICILKLGRAFERENGPEARAWLDRLDFIGPKNFTWLRVNEAAICSLEGRFGEGRRILEEVRATTPVWQVLRDNGLAWCEAHDGAAPAAVERAQKTLELARKVHPTMVAYCCGTLGAALVLAGRASEAVDLLQEALRAGRPPRAQVIRAYYLGEAYRALGRTDEAIHAYERAGREKAESRWAQKAATRMQELAKAVPYR